ncbi:MAG: hypothetical protein HC895_17715 [Leptolyngbyaceae cyanobacterium SM1_3_5]|nr:hypothetical protein [Leptolyngbyaceae cyanobacterium SM1_3_5]
MAVGEGDRVLEETNQGRDLVLATVNFSLDDAVENLVLVTGAGDLEGRGNRDANSITGNEGNNLLDGGGGIDVLAGGAGNDTYVVDSLSDGVIETNTGGTSDTIVALLDYTLPQFVENLILANGVTGGFGNGGANTITGNASGNFLDGQAGADRLNWWSRKRHLSDR